MLDLKAKLLAAGLVTADQVKKVEDDEAARKQRAKEARDARESRPRTPSGNGPRNDRGDGRPHGRGDGPRRGPPDGRRDGPRDGPRDGARDSGPRERTRRPDPNDPLEKEARREHALVEAERWRKRLTELAAAGKADQYEAIRGWVLRHREDNKQITEAAERFHFMKGDGALSHLTVEPDVKERLAAGESAVVTFMGYNGLEHAIVPKDVALDVQQVKPEWLRSLVGVTDQAAEPTAEAIAAADVAEAAAADAAAAAPDNAAAADVVAEAPEPDVTDT